MEDAFLAVTGVRTEADALREARNSALQQRRNKVYCRKSVAERDVFRAELERFMRSESTRYTTPAPTSDSEHCAAIRRISDGLSAKFGGILEGGRFRYGTAQKALNLYLKFLWRLGLLGAANPPHCPVDSTVLRAAGLSGSWTASDSEEEYIGWINLIRRVASPNSLADWEYGIWQSAAKR
jgi:hypothetical protein